MEMWKKLRSLYITFFNSQAHGCVFYAQDFFKFPFVFLCAIPFTVTILEILREKNMVTKYLLTFFLPSLPSLGCGLSISLYFHSVCIRSETLIFLKFQRISGITGARI